MFFIGDGPTGAGTGATQTFTVPAVAKRLYLATSGSLGAADNNTGTFAVSVGDGLAAVTPPTAQTTDVPEPGTFGLGERSGPAIPTSIVGAEGQADNAL